MAKLIVNPTSSSRREIPLARTLVSIGRDPTNDLVLPDAMVSRRHAVIEFRGSQYFLRDCNSSNGSLVNGDRVSERNLRDGDLVAIGTARLLFREEIDSEDVGAKVVQHPSSPRLTCPSCQADYRKGDLFCRNCGAAVAPPPRVKAICTSCGTAVPLPAKFCNACGRPLDVKPASASADNLEVTKPREIPKEPQPEPDPGPGPREVPPPEPKPEGPPIEAAAAPAIAPQAPPETVLPPSEVPPSPRGSMVEAAVARVPMKPHAVPPPRPFTPMPVPRAVPLPPRPVKAEVERSGEVERTAAPATAGFGARLAAALVDTVIVTATQLLLLAPVAYYWRTHELPPAPADVPYWPILLSLLLIPVVVALGCVYYVYYWGVRGATPGKRLLGLAVQAVDGTEPIGMFRATVRVLGFMLSVLLAGIPFLVIVFGGTSVHDRMARTRVVRREKG